MREGGCWIFLSHSSEDIRMVRRIRNEFERLGANPIAFYLRCMDPEYQIDHQADEEKLWKLIEREIDAREWFVFCDSARARQSRNVQRERDYIRRTGKKKIWTLDLEEGWDGIRRDIGRIVRDLEVFISYSHRDSALADELEAELIRRDFSVWDARSDLTVTGNPWWVDVSGVIHRVMREGLFVMLITPAAVESRSWVMEIEEAFREATASGDDFRILPVMVGDPELPPSLRPLLFDRRLLRLPEQPTRADFFRVAEVLEERVLYRIRQFRADGDAKKR